MGLHVMFGSLRGPVGLCREIIAPRRRVSCWRDTFQAGDCEPDGGAAPVLRSWTGRRHRDFDAADADAHECADLEQLEPNGAAGRPRELGIVETDAAQGSHQDVSH